MSKAELKKNIRNYVSKNEEMKELLKETKEEFENIFSTKKIRFPKLLEKVIGKLEIKDLKDNNTYVDALDSMYDKFVEERKITPGEFLVAISPSKTQEILAPALESSIEGQRKKTSGKMEKKSFRDFFELRGANQQCISEGLPNPKESVKGVNCYLCNCKIQKVTSGKKTFFEGADCEHIIPALRAIYFIGLNTNKEFYKNLTDQDLTKIITRFNYDWSHEDCNRTQGKTDILLVSYSVSEKKFLFNQTNAIYLLSKIRKLGHPKTFVGIQTSKINDPDLWEPRKGTSGLCFENDKDGFLDILREKVSVALSVMNGELEYIQETYNLNHNQAITVYAEMCIEILKLYVREEALKYMVSPEEIKQMLEAKDAEQTKEIQSLDAYNGFITDIQEKYTQLEGSYKKMNNLLIEYVNLRKLNYKKVDDEDLRKNQEFIKESVIPQIDYYKDYFKGELNVGSELFSKNFSEILPFYLGIIPYNIGGEENSKQYYNNGVFGFYKIMKGITNEPSQGLIFMFAQLLLFLIMYLHYGFSSLGGLKLRGKTIICKESQSVCEKFDYLESYIFLTLLGIVEEVIQLNLINNINNDTFVEETKRNLITSIKEKKNLKSIKESNMIKLLNPDFPKTKMIGPDNKKVTTSTDKFILQQVKEKYDLEYQYTNFFDLPIGKDIKNLIENTLKFVEKTPNTKYTDMNDKNFNSTLNKLFSFIEYNFSVIGKKRYEEYISETPKKIDEEDIFDEEPPEPEKLQQEDLPPPPAPLESEVPPYQAIDENIPPPPPVIQNLVKNTPIQEFLSFSIPKNVELPLDSFPPQEAEELPSKYVGLEPRETELFPGLNGGKKARKTIKKNKNGKRSKSSKKKSTLKKRMTKQR